MRSPIIVPPDRIDARQKRATALTVPTYIKWEDNRGQTDYVYKNKFHDQDYYPKWIDADEMTFRGTLLPKNAVDVSGNGSYYLQYMFKYGAYADNYPNEAKDENGNYYNGFDIGWAVDPGPANRCTCRGSTLSASTPP